MRSLFASYGRDKQMLLELLNYTVLNRTSLDRLIRAVPDRGVKNENAVSRLRL